VGGCIGECEEGCYECELEIMNVFLDFLFCFWNACMTGVEWLPNSSI
jgi:hypothetical protein